MKQIYHFEQHTPPVLNENMLLAELGRRKLRSQTTLVAAAAILIQVLLILFGAATWTVHPLITAICLTYVVLSATVGSVLAIICAGKGGVAL